MTASFADRLQVEERRRSPHSLLIGSDVLRPIRRRRRVVPWFRFGGFVCIIGFRLAGHGRDSQCSADDGENADKPADPSDSDARGCESESIVSVAAEWFAGDVHLVGGFDQSVT